VPLFPSDNRQLTLTTSLAGENRFASWAGREYSSGQMSFMEPDHTKELEAEIELLKRIGQGDRRSFEELYDRFSRPLFAMAYRVLNNQVAAEEALQDVFIQIWEKAPLYNPTIGKPLTWAVTLTRNKAIDRLRSTQRRIRLQENAQRDAENLERFGDKSSFDVVVSAETCKSVRKAMENLSRDQRQVIELAFFSSMTHTEIAEHLSVPLGTIKTRIRRGLTKLREVISPEL
jgi:RNA polymerase sigma-70 factor, ECF subfamily